MQDILQSSEILLQAIAVVAVELLLLLCLVSISVFLCKKVYHYLLQRAGAEKIKASLEHGWRVFKMLSVFLTALGIVAILAGNGWLLWKNHAPLDFTLDFVKSISEQTWLALAFGLLKIIAAAIVANIAVRIIARVLATARERLSNFSHLSEDDQQLSRFFKSLTHVLKTTVWLFFAVFVTQQLLFPDFLQTLLLKLVTIYLIIGVGVIAARMVAMVVATIHSLCANYAEDKTWHDYYQALEPLVPLLRKSLEYIIWIATATLVIAQLNPIAEFAKYGPRVIESIAIFFIARVFIDAGHLVIDNSQQQEDLDEMAQRRRATILPLFKTIFRYLTYFITLVLILSALGIDVMPFLAGAGILGVVIGFGAQPLINDIVSGFFILFENIFLVDDVIDTGTVLGKVESIDFRTTKVRDPDGNLHILRNGNLEHVKNYSKDFTFAVVEVRVGYDANVSEVREVLEACGKKVREALPDVITSDLDVKGIVEFEPSAMRFRTTTEVKPAKHFIVATRLREVIKAAFDEKGWVMPAEKHQVNVVANS